MAKTENHKYSYLVQDIGKLLAAGRKKASRAVDNILVRTYWEIGKRIVEHEQNGLEKAEYGSQLLKDLSRDLKLKHGKGFSKSNIYLMRLFYLRYEKFQTVSGKLTWSHYTELLSISDNLSRSFYEKQAINENWSVRELKRQRETGLFERIALSKDKKGVLELSQKGLHEANKAIFALLLNRTTVEQNELTGEQSPTVRFIDYVLQKLLLLIRFHENKRFRLPGCLTAGGMV